MAVARFNSDGALDAGFGNNGGAIIDFGGSSASASAVSLQSDGKIVIAGVYGGQAGAVPNGGLALKIKNTQTSFGEVKIY